MSGAQSWTLVIGLLGVMSALIAVVFVQIGGRFDSLAARMEAGFRSVDARFDASDARINARFDAVDARFDATDARIDALDRDVHAVMIRLMDR